MEKQEIHNIPPVIDFYYILDGIKDIIIVIMYIVIIYYSIKLYRKIIKFLDKNS